MFPVYSLSLQDMMLLKLIKMQQQQQKAQKQATAQNGNFQQQQQQPGLFSTPAFAIDAATLQLMTLQNATRQAAAAKSQSMERSTPLAQPQMSNTIAGLTEAAKELEKSPILELGALQKKRKYESVASEEDLSEMNEFQKQKKSDREKKRREAVGALYFKLATIIASLGLNNKPKHKMQRMEILKAVIKLLSPSLEEFVAFEKHIEAKAAEKTNPLLPKNKIKSINEKKRRDRLRLVLDRAGGLVGIEPHSDQSDILNALLKRLSFVTEGVPKCAPVDILELPTPYNESIMDVNP